MSEVPLLPETSPFRSRTRQNRPGGDSRVEGCEAGSYLRLIDFVYHSTLGLRVIKRKRERLRVLVGQKDSVILLMISGVVAVWAGGARGAG